VSNLSKQGFDFGNVNYINHQLYQNLKNDYEPCKGEISLSKDATPGIAFYLDNCIKGIISGGILRLKLKDTIPPYYLELVLNSIFVQLQIEKFAGGSVIKHWKPSEILNTYIPRLKIDKEISISDLVMKSHDARRHAKLLLEKAKRAVEIAIEENEDKAMEFLNDIVK